MRQLVFVRKGKRNLQKNGGALKSRWQTYVGGLDASARAHNTGIDLLRILSMFYIVEAHTITKELGGIFNTAVPGTVQYLLCSLLMAIGMASVDIFGLISGYVGYSEKRKPVRITSMLQLYLQVVTYGVVVAAAFFILRPQAVSIKHFIMPFIPITGNLYWYYTAYFGLFLVMPLLNAGLRHTPKRILRVMLIVMFAAFSVYACFCDRFKTDTGYSTIWLIFLYIMGGILRKCEVGKSLKPWMIAAGIVGLTCVGCLWKAYGLEIGAAGVGLQREMLIYLISPTILGASVLYVIGFSRIRFGTFMMRLAAFASPCVFAVYLLNGSELISVNLLKGRFEYLGTASPLVLVGTVLGFSAAFVAVSILIDRVRLRVFGLLHIPQMLSAVDRAAHKYARKWISDD